jgi:hypothetical protein
MTTFDPNTDYSVASDKTCNDTDSIYETIMDVQNTLEEINQLLLATERMDIETEGQEKDSSEIQLTTSLYDGIF